MNPAYIATLLLVAGMVSLADTPLPAPFPEARYRQMSERSPFAVASAAAPASGAPTPGFAAQLYVDGVARVGQTEFVAIKNRSPEEGKPAVQFLEVGESGTDGLKVEGIKWSNEMGKSTVDVSKDGERATLAFDEDTMAKAAGAPQPVVSGPMIQRPVRMPIMPGQRYPGNPAFVRPGGQFNGVYPQPPQNGVLPGINFRRRIRPILSGQ
jgi:hypothetical protein